MKMQNSRTDGTHSGPELEVAIIIYELGWVGWLIVWMVNEL
jgi:hypothetical protein